MAPPTAFFTSGKFANRRSANSRSGAAARSAARRALAGIVLWLAAGLAPPEPAVAAPLAWLYDVDMVVEGRTATARLAVSGEALAEVLSRVSGLAHVPRNDRVRDALDRPEAYYNRFVFLENGKLRIQFTPGAILELMDEARLPVWSANRPQAILWLVVESGGRRRIVDGQHPLAATLSERARQRGLILKLPLMDLEDRQRVRPAVVRGRLYASLEEASKRYGADVILAGQVQERPCVLVTPADIGAEMPAHADLPGSLSESADGRARAHPGPSSGIEPDGSSADRPASLTGRADPAVSEPDPGALPGEHSKVDPGALSGNDPEPATTFEAPVAEIPLACGEDGASYYSASLQAWMDDDEFATGFIVSDLPAAGLKTVDFLAGELAGRFAVLARQPNRVRLTIMGIDSPVGYGRLMGYLDELEFISSVDVAAVEVGRLEITLHTRAGLEQLVELFDSDGRIRPDPANAAVLIWRGR